MRHFRTRSICSSRIESLLRVQVILSREQRAEEERVSKSREVAIPDPTTSWAIPQTVALRKYYYTLHNKQAPG